MRKLKSSSLPLLAVALWTGLAASAFAQEGEVVPPENPAVTQYTEPFPTAGGETDAHERRHRKVSPDKALGTRNSERLAQRGPDGRAVAALAAETAPSAEGSPAGGGANGNTAANRRGGAPRGTNPGSRTSAGGNRATVAFDPSEANGSSGFGTVLSGALGSQPGGSGLLLPFLLAAAVVVALASVVRQRRVG